MGEKEHGDAGSAPRGRGRHGEPEPDEGPSETTPAAKERAENFPRTPDPEAAQDDLDQAQPGQPSD